MSIKEFFAFSILKPQIIEFLRHKGDFSSLSPKYKKPFRAHFLYDSNRFFVSDGFNQIECNFSDQAQQKFYEIYPQSVKMTDLVGMLICIFQYTLNLEIPQKNQSIWKSTQLKVIMTIDELKVISFDQFPNGEKQYLMYDQQVIRH